MANNNEEQEFAELASLEAFEAEEASQPEIEVAPGQTHFVNPDTGRTEALPEEHQNHEVQEIDAAVLGAVEGVPFAKDALSGVSALGDILANKELGIDQIGEQYQAHKDDWDSAINEAEAKHPGSFIAGDVASGAMLPMAGGMRGAMVFGSLSSVSRLEDRNPYDALKMGGIGGILGAGGHAVGKGLTKVASFVGEKIGMIGTKAGGEAIAGSEKGLTRELNKHIGKFYNRGGKKSQTQATIEFSENMMKKTVDGEPFLTRAQSFDRTAEKAGIIKKRLGKDIGKALDAVDPETKFSGQNVYNEIRESMGLAAKELSDNPDTVAEAAAVDRLLKETFFESVQDGTEKLTEEVATGVVDNAGKPIFRKVEKLVPVMDQKAKEFSLKRLFKLKQDISASGAATRGFGKQLQGASEKKVLSLAESVDTSRISALGSIIEEAVDATEGSLPANINSLKSLNREWADMNMIEKISNKAAMGQMDGPVGRLKRLMGVRGLLVSNIQATTGANGAVSLVLGAAINEIVSDPKTTASIAVSMTKVADAIRIDPNSPYVKRLITAAALSSDALREELSSSASELNLLTSSVERTTDSTYTKSDDILNLLQKSEPETAKRLRAAIRNQDTSTMAQIMDSISKMPGIKKFVQPGIGWDGKVFTAEDVNHLSKQVKKSDISARQKQELLNNLRGDGTIPVINAEPERFFKFKQRNKKESAY